MNIQAYKNMSNPQTVEAFRMELFREHGVMETLDMLALFDYAWKVGHEGGFEEVYYCFADLLDMREDATSQI